MSHSSVVGRRVRLRDGRGGLIAREERDPDGQHLLHVILDRETEPCVFVAQSCEIGRFANSKLAQRLRATEAQTQAPGETTMPAPDGDPTWEKLEALRTKLVQSFNGEAHLGTLRIIDGLLDLVASLYTRVCVLEERLPR